MEWTVVTVIIALAGLGVAVIRPVVSLTQSITKLTVVVDALEDKMRDFAAESDEALDKISRKNSESHARLWEHNKEQDGKIEDHEKRITVMERK